MTAKKKTSRLKWIIIIVLVVVLGGGMVYSSKNKALPVHVGKAQNGTIKSFVEERAKTTLPHVYKVTMPLLGRIEPITLQAGTPVKKGQVVAQLDISNLNTAMEEAWHCINAFSNAVQSSATKVEASQARENYAKWIWNAQQKLYADQKTSELQVKDAERDHIESQVDLRSDQLIWHAMEAFLAGTRLMPVYLRRYLDRSTMTSPIDGVVLKRYVQNKRFLQAGAELLDIGDPSQIEVSADILTDEVTDIKPGNTVDIYGPAIGKEPIHGTVDRIDPQGFTKTSSLGVEQQRVTVKIKINADDLAALKKQGRHLGVDYRVRVRVYTATDDNALIIPRTALFRGNDGTWEVYVVRNGKTELATVQIGLTNDEQAQVTKGLKPGDLVVIAPESSLTGGTRVKYDKPSA